MLTAMSASLEAIYPLLGRRIQQRRTERQFTQEQLGARLDPPVTRASIANIEGGKQRLLVHTLLQVARLFEVSVEDLLPSPPVVRASEPRALESELQRKLDLPVGAAKALARKFEAPPRKRKTRSRPTGSPRRRSR